MPNVKLDIALFPCYFEVKCYVSAHVIVVVTFRTHKHSKSKKKKKESAVCVQVFHERHLSFFNKSHSHGMTDLRSLTFIFIQNVLSTTIEK